MGVELHLREQLSELADRLHLHRRDTGDERAEALHARVNTALEDADHHGLGDTLTEHAVHFEADHPDLARALRRVADALGAAGI